MSIQLPPPSNPRKLTAVELETISWYEQNGREWAGRHGTPDYWASEIATFSELLSEGTVIEIGTGGGRDAAELIRRGYNYIGTEITTALVETARQRLPGALIIQSGIDELDFGNRPFDGFWCSAVLLHLPHHRVRPALESIRRQIRIGGIGFISVKAGAEQSHALEDGRAFFYWPPDEFESELTAAGFEVISYHLKKQSRRTEWICAFVQAAR